MDVKTQDAPPLEEYVDLPALLPAVAHTFPTELSLRWFARQHRAELAAAGALICLAGRLRFHPALFERAAIEIGRSSVRAA